MFETKPWVEGNPESKICFLGEAPARTEMQGGRPLIGPSGKVFDNCLHSASLPRAGSYIVNLFDFEVIKNKTRTEIYHPDPPKELLWSQKKGFTSEGYRHMEPALKRLRECKANVVVPLGGVPLSALYGDARIMKWRGSILWSDLIKKKIIPTIHPAASLHGQFTNRYLITLDFTRIRIESEYKQMKLPNRNLVLNPSMKQIQEYFKRCHDEKKFAIDIEVYNHELSCFCLTPDPMDSICINFFNEDHRDRWPLTEEADIWLLLEEIMEDETVTKVNQNIIFDISVLLHKNNIHTRGKIEDPMIGQGLLYPDFPKGLDFITSIWTREPYYKDDGKLWKKPFAGTTPYKFWAYNAKDGCTALEGWLKIEEELKSEGYWHTYEDSRDNIHPLLYMMTKGMKINESELKETGKKVSTRIHTLESELETIVGFPLNANSSKQCIEYFYGEKRITPYKNRKTGNVTADDLAMSRIVKRYHLPEAKLVQDIRSLRKLHSTYLEVRYDDDLRLRCSYNPKGTIFSRVSSSKTIFETGMNMQNLHSEFKTFIEAG